MITLLSIFTCIVLAVQSPTDPCDSANMGADAATIFSKDSNYIAAKSNIQAQAIDGKEHGISFGKNANGNIIISAMSSGNQHSSKIAVVPNRFADMHNHQDNSPPFSGDLYGFIDLATGNRLYHTRYIITKNGAVYALTIVSLQAATNFNLNYPRIPNPGYQPRFPDDLTDEYRLIRYGHGTPEEMAMAFILEKYNTGVALLKQDSNGNFKRLYTVETIDANGNKIYIANNCQ